ncbi:Fe-S cluster assembly protein SufB [Candidatus Dojkabacteria bacterium]|nr:Fe-S cluster assembly protein SufB [Candidatus Dojkabacteria bacterium]
MVNTRKIKKLKLGYKTKYGFSDKTKNFIEFSKGLRRGIVRRISDIKTEPDWMKERRLAAYEIFNKMPMPQWGADLADIDFQNIKYYVKSTDRKPRNWNEVPRNIKDTFERLGIPQAERKYLAGTASQYDSEVIYHKLKDKWTKLGIIFSDTDSGLKNHSEIFKQYFGTVIPSTDNKFAALNTAVWSGGSFIYVPKGLKVAIPLQAYFRINARNMGQFERTLIIADEGSEVHYIEGCLPAGELVSKGHKFVNIESIKPSEEVISEKGEFSRVKSTMVRPYRGNMITIIPQSKGNSFQITTEHPILCIKRDKVKTKRKLRNGWKSEVLTEKLNDATPEYVKADEVEVGDFITYVTPTAVKDRAHLSEDILKLLGVYLAEGSVSFNKSLNLKNLCFSFGKKESEEIFALETKSLIDKLGEKSSVCRTKGGYYVVTSYSKKLIDLCLKHCGKGATTKLLSKDIMTLPPEKQKFLLDNYIKGDGNVYVKRPYFSKMVRSSTASRLLAYQIQEILARLGVFANIAIRKGGKDIILGRKIVRKNQFIVEYTDNKKFSEVRKKDNLFFVPIKEIRKEDYDGFVFNLDVKSPDSYLVKGFAVHNCTAPTYTTDSLHAAVVEIIVKKNARVRYTTIQNWSNNVYNLVTKRAIAHENAVMEWVDCNLGSKVTMKYPSVYLVQPRAHGEVLSIAMAGKGQHQDAGAKMIHSAKNTTSIINSKSICFDGGRTSYRGLMKIHKGAKNSKSQVTCDALILDNKSRTDTYPYNEIDEKKVTLGHEASVSKVSEAQRFYLMSRGISEEEANAMILSGFIEPIAKELPMEYAIELNALIQMSMEGSVG